MHTAALELRQADAATPETVRGEEEPFPVTVSRACHECGGRGECKHKTCLSLSNIMNMSDNYDSIGLGNYICSIAVKANRTR